MTVAIPDGHLASGMGNRKVAGSGQGDAFLYRSVVPLESVDPDFHAWIEAETEEADV
jgi:hypothetical protein